MTRLSVLLLVLLPIQANAQTSHVDRGAVIAALRNLREADLPERGAIALEFSGRATAEDSAIAAGIGAELRQRETTHECFPEDRRTSCRLRDVVGVLGFTDATTLDSNRVRIAAWTNVQMARPGYSWLYGRWYEVIVARANDAWRVVSVQLMMRT